LATVELSGAAAAQGVTVEVAADPIALLDPPDPDGLTALHDAFVPEVVVVRVPDGAVVEGPLVVVQHVSGDGVAAFAHLVVMAGSTSEVTVLDHAVSGEGAALSCPVVELQAADGAHLSYVGVQELGDEAWQAAHLLISTGRDATVRAWHVALGGGYARLYVDADLPGLGSSAEVAAVYFGDSHQTHDFRSVQDHRGSRSRSNLLLKGAVVDEAHGVYTGLIRVHEGAKATESFLTNRNLVLSDGAHVDSVPNLEIVNENDIRSCGHAAATGPIDEEHLFYLESRGVPTEAAERLIVFGFFDDVVSTVPVPGVRAPLRAAVSRKLDRATIHA
ncbi:MAG TPA: Fe-S cluster assembly protein SufD, partial [Acidimicrobiales bacterium]|nr:Fe-S cluster assembly protein SufD [Acidimicrobiales bacterium]